MVNRFRQTIILISLIILVSAILPAHAANIIARTDRVKIGLNESFTLVFEANGKVDDDPDFGPLQQNFEILNNSQNSSISLINGQMERRVSWTLQLFPKRGGNLLIPAINFGKDQSPELQIKVDKQTASTQDVEQEIFLEAEATPQTPFLQQQVLYTVRLYRAVATSNDRLGEPELGNQDAVLNKFGEDRSYDKVINGRRYIIYERQYMIFPQREGTLNIPPIQYSGVVGNTRRGFFDPFNAGGKPVRSLSKAINLKVRPVPAEFKGHHWLPAKQITLHETWSPNPPQFKVGEPVTRNITITANGLTAAQLPELPSQTINNFKLYPDQPSLDDALGSEYVIGKRIEKLALIPTAAGHYTLPAIEIAWWNTQSQKQEIARLASKVIEVKAISGNSPKKSTPQVIDENTNTTPAQATTTITSINNNGSGFWPWLSILMTLAWLTTLYLWWRQKQLLQQLTAATANEPARRVLPDTKKALKQLENACQQNQAQEAKQALLYWAQAQWPELEIHSLIAVAANTNDSLTAQIMELNTVLYRNNAENWQGDGLWTAFKAWEPETQDLNKKQQPLAPLHNI